MIMFSSISTQPAFVFFITLVISIVFVVFFSSISLRLGLVDLPGGRKKHRNSVPLVGGLAILGGVSLTLGFYIFTNLVCFAFWLACVFLVCVGTVDDKRPLPSHVRFIIQFFSLGIIIFLGKTVIVDLGNLFSVGPIQLGLYSIPFTCFAMIGVINAVNMMDGVDGLTGGVSGIELGVLCFLAILQHAIIEISIIACFMGGILGFLIFNFPSPFSEKRKVFLGDAGSMLIGFTLAWLCVRLTQMPNGYPPVLMLWVMALPLLDTVHLIINRKMRGVSVFRADRRHVHHILLQLNYSSRQISLILMCVSLCTSIVGIYLYLSGANDCILLCGFILLFIIYSSLSHRLKKRVASRKYKLFGNMTN